jgi:hypothetical protein
VARHTFRRKNREMTPLTRTRGSRVLALTATFGALAFGATACGSSSDTDPDPAQAVPASAPVYAQVTVKPDGDLQANTEAVLKKLGVDDPAKDITQLLKDSTDDPNSVDDVKEWIGSRAGVFVTSFTGDPDAAVVMGTSDPDKAADNIDKDGRKKGSYKDVDYWFDEDGNAVQGVVGDYAVSGTERAFRTVVDTVKGDDVDTIADNGDYQAGLKAIGSDDALATAYVSTEGVLNAIGRSGGIPAQQLGQIRQQLAQIGGKTTVVKLAPSSNSITLEVATLGLKEGEATSGAAATALAGLPGDAWLGVGLPHVGETLRGAMQQGLQVASAAGQDVNGQLQAIQQALGIDIDKDLLSWMGDGGLFASGAAATNLGGALVLQTTDAAKAQQAVRKLATLVPQIADGVHVRRASVAGADEAVEFRTDGFPFPIVAAVGNDRFVLGVGDKAVAQGLSPSTTLADSPSFKSASQALGDVKPAFFLDVGAVGSLLGALVPATDPDTQQVLSAVQKVSTIAAGTQRDGSTQRTKIVVTLK